LLENYFIIKKIYKGKYENLFPNYLGPYNIKFYGNHKGIFIDLYISLINSNIFFWITKMILA